MKVSLVISTYNWKEALKLCLLSVTKQTLIPTEVIIADDGSRMEHPTSSLKISNITSHAPSNMSGMKMTAGKNVSL